MQDIHLSTLALMPHGTASEGNGNPLQYSCLENPMDRGAWWAKVHGVAKSWTRLSGLTFFLSGGILVPRSGTEPTSPAL